MHPACRTRAASRRLGRIGRISNRTDAHASLARLGVTPAIVRTWACEQGLEPAVRGSLQIEVVQAYVDAHAEQVTA